MRTATICPNLRFVIVAGVESIRGVIGFVRTVAAGSFAGAAKELGVSPVAVSKNVQRLERRLGVRLLQRSTRKLGLTEEGRLFYERCIGPLRELEGLQAAVKDSGPVTCREAARHVGFAVRSNLRLAVAPCFQPPLSRDRARVAPGRRSERHDRGSSESAPAR